MIAKIFTVIASYIRVNTFKAIKDFYICLTTDHHLILQKLDNKKSLENNEINYVNKIKEIDRIFNDEDDMNNLSLKKTKKVFNNYCFFFINYFNFLRI